MKCGPRPPSAPRSEEHDSYAPQEGMRTASRPTGFVFVAYMEVDSRQNFNACLQASLRMEHYRRLLFVIAPDTMRAPRSQRTLGPTFAAQKIT